MRELVSMPGDRPKYLGAKEETLTCRECNNTWTRISRRVESLRSVPHA
jgi:hypothetical protein